MSSIDCLIYLALTVLYISGIDCLIYLALTVLCSAGGSGRGAAFRAREETACWGQRELLYCRDAQGGRASFVDGDAGPLAGGIARGGPLAGDARELAIRKFQRKSTPV